MATDFDAWEIELHGHRVIYRIAGSGPPVVLIHGMVNSSRHWEDVALRLADRYTVIAPDLIGHGDSATPRGDYSLGAHAASIRDLLAVDRSRPRDDRRPLARRRRRDAVLLPVPPAHRAPGAGLERRPRPRGQPDAARRRPAGRVGAAPRSPPTRVCSARCRQSGERMRERGSRKGVYLQAVARALRPLRSAGARTAFLQTLRSVIDVHGPAGQRARPALPARRISHADRLGRARQHDPDRARPRGARGDPGQPLRHPAAGRALPAPGGPGGAGGGSGRVHLGDRSGKNQRRRLGGLISPRARRQRHDAERAAA